MRQRTDLPAVLDVEVTTHGQLPDAEDYARTKIGDLAALPTDRCCTPTSA